MRRVRTAALSGVVALIGAALGVTAATASVPTTSVTLELRPTSESALHALVAARGLSRNERARRIAALVPGARRRDDVGSVARDLGLTVERSTTWSVRVQGPTELVAQLFGTLPPQSADVAGRAYPALPAALQPYVIAALPTTGRVAKPLVSLSPRTGLDFRTAYSAPPGSTGAGLAVATVQLSGWHQTSGESVTSCPKDPTKPPYCDLQHYADRQGIAFDVTKQYTAISVDNASTTTPDGQAGDEEVALDQEALLATAPGARQLAYFAPNNDDGTGYIDAIRLVGSQAAANHTAALSLSWGGCEASDDRQWVASMDQALEFTLAAGVTIFAASGDQGSMDCFGEVFGPAADAPAVDFPASSPYVVGVGGTSLPASGSTASAVGWDGSGGGESAVESLPSWQVPVASSSRTNHRLVPDIASDADPNNGLCVYESSTVEAADRACPAGEFMLGGTSLASPTQAALLVDTLAAVGWQSGIGDIHAALYSGAAKGAITDITADEDPAGNGSYHSARGYDLVTGLGTPIWTSLQSWLGQFDMGAPRATRSLAFAIAPHASPQVSYSSWSPVLLSPPADGDCAAATQSSPPTSVALPAGAPDGTYQFWVAAVANAPAANSCHIGVGTVVLDRRAPATSVSVRVAGAGLATASWTFADAAPTSGLRKFVVVATSGGKTVWSSTTTNRSRTFTALPQTRWLVSVTAYDNAGNTSTARARLFDDVGTFSLAGHWSRISSRAAFRRSYIRSSSVGSAAKFTTTAKTVVLYVTECSSCGRLGVFDTHGRRLKTVDTYSASTRYRVPVTIRALRSPVKQTLVLRVLPGRNAHSHGRYVGIDGMSIV